MDVVENPFLELLQLRLVANNVINSDANLTGILEFTKDALESCEINICSFINNQWGFTS